MCGRIALFKRPNPFQELLGSPLLEQAHQWRTQRFSGSRRDLGYRRSRPGALLDKAASDLLEFEVSGDIGGNEDVGELAIGHEKFGH